MTIRAVFPEIPEPPAWLPYLEPSLANNWHTNFGPVATGFEGRLATMFADEGERVVSASNATAGLTACLIAERIKGPVLCPAFTFQATPAAILAAGCTPVICDVDLKTGVLAPDDLGAALDETNAQAVVAVVPYGIAIDLSDLVGICRSRNVLLVIDNAAGLGVRRDYLPKAPNVREVFSLHATKPFGIGEGGAIFVPEEAEGRVRSAINFGLPTHTASGAEKPPFWGINGKLPEVGAAIGLSVCDTIEERIASRQGMAANWLENLAGTDATPFSTAIGMSPWQVFPVLLKDEHTVNRLSAAMAGAGMELRRYYHPSLGACSGMARVAECPNAKNLSSRAIVLPVRSFLPDADRDHIVDTTLDCLAGVS